MIGLCTDSNSQLPDMLAQRYGVAVVPVTVTVDDHDYLEGVDLDADRFYEMLSTTPRPTVSTSHPSPGQFAVAYESLLHRGCDEILSIHVTAASSETLNSARLATRSLPIPVRLVDSGTVGFGVSCCTWRAAEAIARRATLEEAASVAESLAPGIRAVFLVGQLQFLRTGNPDRPPGIPVMQMARGELHVVTHVDTLQGALDEMVSTALAGGTRLNVAVGLGDRTGEALVESLAATLAGAANVLEVVRYRIGPSMGAYTGLGTVACVAFPAD